MNKNIGARLLFRIEQKYTAHTKKLIIHMQHVCARGDWMYV